MTQKVDKKETSILLSALDNYGGHPFDEIFDVVFPVYAGEEVAAARELSSKVAVVIWGGADISPSIYGQLSHRDSGPDTPSRRDQLEMDIAYKAMELGIPIIGICRGAQLMCALSGGTLIQHVDNHAGGYHNIVTRDGEKYNCPSLHHQMMFPYRSDIVKDKVVWHPDAELLAWAEPQRSKVYQGAPAVDDRSQTGLPVPLPEGWKEPEVVWFRKTKSICIQSHPEFITDKKHPFVQYCLSLVKEYCDVD